MRISDWSSDVCSSDLAKTVRDLGGQPVEPLAAYEFPTDKLKSEADVLRFAAGLEKGAVSAYLGAVPLFADRELAKAAASILGDEAMHWAVRSEEQTSELQSLMRISYAVCCLKTKTTKRQTALSTQEIHHT